MLEKPYKWSSSPPEEAPSVSPCWKIGFLSTPALVPSAGKVATTAAGSIISRDPALSYMYVLFLLALCSVTSLPLLHPLQRREIAPKLNWFVVRLMCVCGWE